MNLLKWIINSYLSVGMTDSDHLLNQSIRITNFLCLFASGIIFITTSFYLVFGFYLYFFASLPVLLFINIPLFLNKLGYFHVSKVVLLVVFLIAVVYGVYLLGYDIGVQYYIFPCLTIMFFIMREEDNRGTYFIISLATIALASIFVFRNDVFTGVYIFPPGIKTWLINLHGLFALLSIAIMGFIFRSTVREYEEKQKQQAVVDGRHAKLLVIGKLSEGVAHEVNNPLSILDLSLRHVKRVCEVEISGEQNEFLKKFFASMEKSILRIKQVVGNLRKFSVDQHAENTEYVKLHYAIENALAFCLQKFKLEKLNVRCELENIKDCLVNGSYLELEQAFINLIENAIQAINDSSQGELVINAEVKNEVVIVRVEDNGKGIDEKIVDKIFDPFFTTKPMEQGVGIGLTLVQGIIESHGGKCELASAKDKTTFEVSIPISNVF